MQLLELLNDSLGQDAIAQLGAQIGADPGATQAAVGAILPTLIGGLAQNTQQAGGAEALHQALNRDHDGSILDNLAGMLGDSGILQTHALDGGKILGHILGGNQGAVQQALGGASGLDAAQVAQLMAILAPVVMGAIGRMTRQQGMDPGGVAGVLNETHAQQASHMPQEQAGILNVLLDRNRDGNIADDVISMGASLLGSLFRR